MLVFQTKILEFKTTIEELEKENNTLKTTIQELKKENNTLKKYRKSVREQQRTRKFQREMRNAVNPYEKPYEKYSNEQIYINYFQF